MFFRVTETRRGEHVYRYGYLVESYRRESDGRPTQRTLLKLGRLTDREIANYRVAFDAQKLGARVVLADDVGALPQPNANLEYLDIAVLLEAWKGWDLSALVDQLIPKGRSEVPASTLLAALTCQRCVDPGSKLAATRWIPTTALPELFGVPPVSWNNSRIHRVLDQVADIDGALQSALSTRYARRDGAFVALYLDTTDAVFVGQGPPQAQRSKWKDGVLKRRIGIALLCNEYGYPMRWKVVEGRAADCETFVDVVKEVAGHRWAADVPVIMDRAAGSTATVEELLATDLHVLTPLRRTEFSAYLPSLPTEPFEGLSGDGEALRQAAIDEAKKLFKRVSDDLFVLDFETLRRSPRDERHQHSQLKDDPAGDREKLRRCREALALAREAVEAVERGHAPSFAAFARQREVGKSVLTKYRSLLRLTPELLDAIDNEQLVGVSLGRLTEIAKLPKEEQGPAVAAIVAPRPAPEPDEMADEPEPTEPLVRCVAYFNPDIFVAQRATAAAKLERVHKAIVDFNAGLRKRTRKLRDIRARVDRLLQTEGLLSVFSVRIKTRGKGKFARRQVVLDFDAERWQRRRRYDGFSVLVGHPELGRTAKELSFLYRTRNCVEHDFRIVKSFIELAPVRHRLERKVKAHVTICMLALLLERTLRRKFDGALAMDAAAAPPKDGTSQDGEAAAEPKSKEAPLTVQAGLELLKTCRLNHFHTGGYIVTRPTPTQRELLANLGLDHLADNEAIARRITPR